MNSYRITTPKKALILGSGAQKIGQGGEFDYAEYQAINALKAEGILTVLLSPNMTACSTSERVADATYFLPVTTEFAQKVIEREKPDSIVVCLGGKAAFSCARDLAAAGILEKYDIQSLGTPIESIAAATGRSSFAELVKGLGLPAAEGKPAKNAAEARRIAEGLGYPVMVRADAGMEESVSAVCDCADDLEAAFNADIPNEGDLRVERWLGGWKEVELEILRDSMDNCVMVACLENVDPLGIHTGDSIVVTPAQTLTDADLRRLRDAAFAVARAIGVIGEASVRFALDPLSDGYLVIEANPCASRGTVLAAKTSGVPLGDVLARVMLGFALSELQNRLTGTTHFGGEPAMDYVAVKIPRWDTGKFQNVDRHLGSQMKSVGQSMAFGRTFEEALQKAIRTSDSGEPGLACHGHRFKDVKEELRNPTDIRVFAIYEALREGWSVDRVHKYARIDRWFIDRIARILEIELALRALPKNSAANIPKTLLLDAKKAGFSDAQVADCAGSRAEKIRALRREYAIRPVVKQIDTVAGTRPSKSNYLYVTWSGVSDDVKPSEKGALVIGSGPYHIGSGIEYDWCCTSALSTMRQTGTYSIMVNCNPESVSTDHALADRLYFEELSLERVLDIYEAEKPDGVILSMGGQSATALAIPLARHKVPIFGTAPEDIDRAEDRNKFGALLDQLGILQPEWTEATNVASAQSFAEKTGYPVLVRPDRGVSGAAMGVAWDDASLKAILARTPELGSEHPAIVTRYVENSKEIEIDAVARDGELLVYAISEHIENAGVHSGDATVVLPAQRIYLSTARAVKKAARKIAEALEITGPFNVKFLAKSTYVQAIECDLRASRSFPFCSKVFGIDFADIAARAILGAPVEPVDGARLDFDHVGVRAAQFSYSRLKGADPVAGIEMASTGEVGCIGRGVRDAFMKAMLSTGYRVPRKKILLSTGPIEDKVDFIDSARKLRGMGYEIVASGGTARFLNTNGVEATALAWPLEDKKPNIADALRNREVDLVINIPKNNRETELKNDYIIRRLSVDCGIPLITNIKIAKQFTDALEWYKTRGLETKSREEYR